MGTHRAVPPVKTVLERWDASASARVKGVSPALSPLPLRPNGTPASFELGADAGCSRLLLLSDVGSIVASTVSPHDRDSFHVSLGVDMCAFLLTVSWGGVPGSPVSLFDTDGSCHFQGVCTSCPPVSSCTCC